MSGHGRDGGSFRDCLNKRKRVCLWSPLMEAKIKVDSLVHTKVLFHESVLSACSFWGKPQVASTKSQLFLQQKETVVGSRTLNKLGWYKLSSMCVSVVLPHRRTAAKYAGDSNPVGSGLWDLKDKRSMKL
jgi:hypothetical protein